MTRIRVDPANLRQAAQQLSGIADRLRALGSEAHQATFNAPSYEGQFGPKARAMGMEAEARLRAQADRFTSLSEELEARTAAFEAVDQETLTAFDRLTQLLRDWIEQAKPILTPYTQIALFPWQKVERYLGLGPLMGSTIAGVPITWISDTQPPPDPLFNPQYIERVSMTELSVFFSQYEYDSRIPDDVREKYLTNPALMRFQRDVIVDLIDRIEDSNNSPLTPQEFYTLVENKVGDPGTSLIVCHNVLKAMARGYSPIGWDNISRNPLVYSLEGHDTYIEIDTTSLHPDAVPLNNRGEPSAFYIIFSAESLGTNDPGDWYHYNLEAATADYAATGRADLNDFSSYDGPFDYTHVVGRTVSKTAGQFFDADLQDSRAYQGWRWANSLSFLEGGHYGTDYTSTIEQARAETFRESQIHMQGAIFGLELAGEKPAQGWQWYVPEPGSVDEMAGVIGIDVEGNTYTTLNPSAEPIATTTSTITPTPIPDEPKR